MNKEEIEAEIAQIRAKREGKRGRMPNADRDRIAELEAMLAEDSRNSDETPDIPTTSEPQPMSDDQTVNILVMHHNLGVPVGGPSAGKALQHDVVAVPADFADVVEEKGMARKTSDPVTVEFVDGKRREVVSAAVEGDE